MDKEEFVDALKIAVGQSTVSGVKSILTKPPGRNPDQKLVALSDWYNKLADTDKENLHEVINHTVDSALFGTLCVLDGVRAIENSSDKGELVLEYHRHQNIVRLNEQRGMYLHDIYNSK